MALLILENLRNRHAGRLGIVAGAGPSLRHLESEQAEKHIMLAVNSAVIKFPKAQYFMTCDPATILYRSWQVARDSTCMFVLSHSRGDQPFGSYDDRIGRPYDTGIKNRVILIPRKSEQYSAAFQPDDTELIFGDSSAHCALHLAYLMGCKPIVIVGCDCGSEDGRHYYSEFPDQEQYEDGLADESLREYLPPTDKAVVPSFVNYWNRIGADNPTLEIYNCGNAILPEIQPTKLSDILKRYE